MYQCHVPLELAFVSVYVLHVKLKHGRTVHSPHPIVSPIIIPGPFLEGLAETSGTWALPAVHSVAVLIYLSRFYLYSITSFPVDSSTYQQCQNTTGCLLSMMKSLVTKCAPRASSLCREVGWGTRLAMEKAIVMEQAVANENL